MTMINCECHRYDVDDLCDGYCDKQRQVCGLCPLTLDEKQEARQAYDKYMTENRG